MTKKTKAEIKPMRESLAFLIEDVLERSEVVIAASEIVEKLQKIAEDLGKIQVDDIMPLLDSLTNTFGQQIAQQFNQVATDQMSQLITAVQAAKTALDGEIVRLKKGVEGGNMSDMAMDAGAAPSGAPEAPPGAPPMAGGPTEGPPESGAGLPEMPSDGGNVEDDMAAGFAGRPRKESAQPRGKKITEAPFDGAGAITAPTISDPLPTETHPYKSGYFHCNIDALKSFHGGLGRLARNIEHEIDSGKLNGSEREGLCNALSSMAMVGADAGHWVDPESKLETALKANHIINRDDPTVAAVIHELRKLAHGLSLRHANVMENSIIALRKSANPDALILNTFRTKLSEAQDGQMAAIRTARQFAIDIEDVVTIVREAAAAGTKLVRSKLSEDGMMGMGAPTGAPTTGVPTGAPIFPVQATTGGAAPAVPDVTPGTPNAIGPNPVNQQGSLERSRTHNFATGTNNRSQSARTPMSPSDKRMALAMTDPSQSYAGMPQEQPARDPAEQNAQQLKRKMAAGTGRSPMPNIR